MKLSWGEWGVVVFFVCFFLFLAIFSYYFWKADNHSISTVTLSDGRVYEAVGTVEVRGKYPNRFVVFHDSHTEQRVEVYLGEETFEVRFPR